MEDLKPKPKPRLRSVSAADQVHDDRGAGNAELFETGNIGRETCYTDLHGLPSCVKLRYTTVSVEQRKQDALLPLLFHELDDACKQGSSDVAKKQLAKDILCSASSPGRKYRLLNFYLLLESNKHQANVLNMLASALVILEKYATNLLKRDKHHLWRTVRYNLDIIKNQLVPVTGALDVLQQMGYTNASVNALSFPDDVEEPNIGTIVVLASDLVIARCEVDSLFNKSHPFVSFCPNSSVGDTYAAGALVAGAGAGVGPLHLGAAAARAGAALLTRNTSPEGFCGVCSEENVATFCPKCDMKFCEICDTRYHLHITRRSHVRSGFVNTGQRESARKEQAAKIRPVPAPRQRKSLRDDSSIAINKTGHAVLEKNPGAADIAEAKSRPIKPKPAPVFNMQGATTPLDQNGTLPAFQSPEQPWPVSCQNCSMLFSKWEASCPNCRYPVTATSPVNLDPNLDPRHGSHHWKTAPSAQPARAHNSSGYDHLQLFHELDKWRNYGPADNLTTEPLSPPHSQIDRRLPELPARQVLAQASEPEDIYEEIDDRGYHREWNCEFCTLSNPITTKICMACFKTPSDMKNHPTAFAVAPQGTIQAAKTGNDHRGMNTAPSSLQQSPLHDQILMTPKNSPLDGGIYMVPTHPPLEPPPLPARPRQTRGGGSVHKGGGKEPAKVEECKPVFKAQQNRERELSEKEKIQKSFDLKKDLLEKGLITDNEFYNIEEYPTEDDLMIRRRLKQHPDLDEAKIRRLIQTGNLSYDDLQLLTNTSAETITSHGDLALSDEQLLQLMQGGGFSQDVPAMALIPEPIQPRTPNAAGGATAEELQQLYDAGIITEDERRRGQSSYAPTPAYATVARRKGQGEVQRKSDAAGLTQSTFPGQVPRKSDAAGMTEQELSQGVMTTGIRRQPEPSVASASKTSNEIIDEMMQEFQRVQTSYDHVTPHKFGREGPGADDPHRSGKGGDDGAGNHTTFSNVFNYRVSRDLPKPFTADSFYDKTSSKNVYGFSEQDGRDNTYMSLPNHLENRGKSYGFLEEQGRMYIKWMKEAEKFGFMPEELNLATNLSWQDAHGRNPVQWLKEEWTSRLAAVIGQVTELTASENDQIGHVSADEAKEALLDNHGSVESACKACIENRREKLTKMSEVAVYARADCLSALDNHNGNVDQALFELEMKALEPFRKRILEPGDDEERAGHRRLDPKFIDMVRNDKISAERRARIILAEQKVSYWGRAETAVKLIDRKFTVNDAIEAANAFGDLERSLGYLQQECPVCMERRPMGQMITYLNCQDRICKDCVAQHLTFAIKEKNIHHLACPVCGRPDLADDFEATEFFNNLDVIMREIVDEDVHDLFQQKLRDRMLRKEPNFRWCAHCAFGFIHEVPNTNHMICPNCKKGTCFECKRKWAVQHEGISCEQFARWMEENDEEYQMEGLAGHLARNGIDCPQCKSRYDLAKGGCMHFKCTQCTHEFCSGCFNPIKHGAKCRISPRCANRGLHAHHPRDCLFHLRDWTPGKLQELLNNEGVDYHIPERAEQQPQEVEGEQAGAVGGQNVRLCRVPEQKENADGLVDAECGARCEDGHEALCKVHYTEYLVSLINRNGIDPANLMNAEDMSIALHRSDLNVPEREAGEDEEVYQDRLRNVLKTQLPLGHQAPERIAEAPAPAQNG